MTAKSKSAPVPLPAKPPSLKTIANHLGLSTAAVSRVLSNSPAAKSIPASTQQKILAAAEHFNYRPNALARSLRSRRTFTLGVMVPELSEGYATLVLSGIEQRLLESDFFYFVVSHHHRPELIERYQQLLLARSIEGLIAIDTPLTSRLHIPTVTVSGHHEPAGVTNIQLNHRRAAALAIQHLHDLGHTHIAFIKGQQFSSDTRPRWNAIRHAMAAAGIPLDPRLVVQLEGDAPTHSPGYLATQRLLANPGAPASGGPSPQNPGVPASGGPIPQSPGAPGSDGLIVDPGVSAPKLHGHTTNPGAPGSDGLIVDPGVSAPKVHGHTTNPGAPASGGLIVDPGVSAPKLHGPRTPPFTALFAFNDISAIGAIRALRESGLRVPEDISVVGFDDVQSAAFQNPGLTTVRQPLHQMGILAAQTVLDQIHSPPGIERAVRHINRTVNPELIVRGSTGPALPHG